MTQPRVTAAQFSKAMRKFEQETVPNAVKQRQSAVVAYIWEKLLLRTPIDTSLARGNWFINIGDPDLEATELTAGVETLGAPMTGRERARIKSVLSRLKELPLGQTVWISNNLYYLKFLEGGHSDQAPEGMVALTVAEVKELVDFSTAVEDNEWHL